MLCQEPVVLTAGAVPAPAARSPAMAPPADEAAGERQALSRASRFRLAVNKDAAHMDAVIDVLTLVWSTNQSLLPVVNSDVHLWRSPACHCAWRCYLSASRVSVLSCARPPYAGDVDWN